MSNGEGDGGSRTEAGQDVTSKTTAPSPEQQPQAADGSDGASARLPLEEAPPAAEGRDSAAQATDELEAAESEPAAPAAGADAREDDVEMSEALVNQATEALAAGQASYALHLARQATEAAPGYASAWVLLGMVAGEAGARGEALAAYRVAADLDPDRPGLAESLEAAEKAAVAPPPPPGWATRVQADVLDRYAPMILAAAVGLLVIAVGFSLLSRHYRWQVQQHYTQVMNDGIQALALQQYDRSEADFTEALRLRPNDAQALSWLQNTRDGRERLASYQKWQYETMGGRFPGVTTGSLSSGAVQSSADQAAAAAEAAAAQQQDDTSSQSPEQHTRSSGDYSSHHYSWRGAENLPGPPSTAFPSPQSEGTPNYEAAQGSPAQSASGQGSSQTSGLASTHGPQPLVPQASGAQAAQPAQGRATPAGASAATGAGAGATQEPQGYIRITVGEPKPASATSGGASTSTSPTADEVRNRADALAAAGHNAEAKQAYQEAITLYEKEAAADPETRAVSQAGAETCRRAIDRLQ